MFIQVVHKGSFSISLPTLLISSHFGNSHSDRCEVIPHCGFDLHFLVISDVNLYFLDDYIGHFSCAS